MLKPERALAVIQEMVGTVSFFPSDAAGLRNVAIQACRFIEDEAKLAWLVGIFVNHISEWKGIKEFRAVYCTKYKPMDGIEEYSTFRGFSPGDIEGDHIESAKRFKHMEKGGGDLTLPDTVRALAKQRKIV